jgi:hypothetical protein
MKNTIIQALQLLRTGDADAAEKTLYKKLSALENPKAKKELSIWDFAKKTEKVKADLSPALNGIYYHDGNMIASDGFVMIVRKSKYDPSKEGKVFNRDDKEINEKYPEYWRIIPSILASKHIPLLDVINDCESKKLTDMLSIMRAERAMGEANSLEITPEGDIAMTPHVLDMFIQVTSQIVNYESYLSHNGGILMLVAPTVTFLFMLDNKCSKNVRYKL